MPNAADPAERHYHPGTLLSIFGLYYFAQGISEPTEGLIAQPVRSLLQSWSIAASEIGSFMAILAVPWTLKPLYGLLSDYLPIAGYRRASYLVLTSAAAALALVLLYLWPPARGNTQLLLVVLLIPTLGVAFSDVVVDALMVELGQPRGMTGRLQSAQWGSIYAASILAGIVGGRLSQWGWQTAGFLIAAAGALATLAVTLIYIRERRRRLDLAGLVETTRLLGRAAISPEILSVGAILFLWHFNPFSTTILQLHMTDGLGLSQQFYGDNEAVMSVGSMVGCYLYGFYCHRLKRRTLVHLSIIMGVQCTLHYWFLRDEFSATWIALVYGFTNATSVMVQLDLAARVCPPQAAATVFALLMALANLGKVFSLALGGYWYETWTGQYGDRVVAFNLLVGIGALFTAGCWFIAPAIDWAFRHRRLVVEPPGHAA